MKDKTATSAFIDRIPYMSFLFFEAALALETLCNAAT
jgi:hypothetical protein